MTDLYIGDTVRPRLGGSWRGIVTGIDSYGVWVRWNDGSVAPSRPGDLERVTA